MSCNYAEGLSPYENKGKLGLAETVDSKDEFDKKVKQLSQWIEESKHVVVHTGAGISTSAGIPDFRLASKNKLEDFKFKLRGPNGVWTLEKKGIKPKINISFDDAVPTPTHMAITELVKHGKIHYVVSQNIDALHLRSGLSRKYLAELHGNMYVDQCNKCERQFVRKTATNSVGQKNLNIPCPYRGFRPCRGTLHDTILDWEHNLPQRDINLGDYNSSIADLSICLGTTLQINPSGLLPTYTKKYNQGKLVICNLSSTKHDKKADLFIRGYVDDILVGVMKHLNLSIPEYDEKLDPSRTQEKAYKIEWTLLPSDVSKVKRRYEEKMRENKKRKMKSKEENVEEEEEEEVKNGSKKQKLKEEKNGEILEDKNGGGRSKRGRKKRHVVENTNDDVKEEDSDINETSNGIKMEKSSEDHGCMVNEHNQKEEMDECKTDGRENGKESGKPVESDVKKELCAEREDEHDNTDPEELKRKDELESYRNEENSEKDTKEECKGGNEKT